MRPNTLLRNIVPADCDNLCIVCGAQVLGLTQRQGNLNLVRKKAKSKNLKEILFWMLQSTDWNGSHPRNAVVSKIQWKPFWLPTQLATERLVRWQIRANYDVCPHAQSYKFRKGWEMAWVCNSCTQTMQIGHNHWLACLKALFLLNATNHFCA